jgi:FAD/FMN-containing dehydrogenase
MRWGSLSSQVRGLKVILANGTLLELADPAENMHLWRALGVSVGRLGVLAELTLRIVPQRAVEKRLQDLDFDAFAAQVAEAADAYAAAIVAGDPAAVDAALFSLDEVQAFWHLAPLGGNATGAVWRVDYARPDKLPGGGVPSVSLADPAVAAMDGPPEGAPGAFAALPFEPLAAAPEIATDPEYWAQLYRDSLRSFVAPGTFPARKAYLATTEASTYLSSTLFPYDQYEVAVPLAAAGACLARLRREVYGPAALWAGFRVPALVRFVAGEDLYLSPTAGGPRMCACGRRAARMDCPPPSALPHPCPRCPLCACASSPPRPPPRLLDPRPPAGTSTSRTTSPAPRARPTPSSSAWSSCCTRRPNAVVGAFTGVSAAASSRKHP